MHRMRSLLIAALMAALVLPLSPVSGLDAARAADFTATVAAPAYDNVCGAPSVLARIEYRFAAAERGQWRRGFVIDTLSNARPSGHPYYEPGIIKRDYCVADSVMTNGATYPVYYTVEHGAGFAGLGTYVDFCVLGLDPWHVHDGFCRTVR